LLPEAVDLVARFRRSFGEVVDLAGVRAQELLQVLPDRDGRLDLRAPQRGAEGQVDEVMGQQLVGEA
jgi:hypothetical protein